MLNRGSCGLVYVHTLAMSPAALIGILVLLSCEVGVADDSFGKVSQDAALLDEFGDVAFGKYPESSAERDIFDAKLGVFQDTMWEDFRTLRPTENPLTPREYRLLDDYLTLRDSWFKSEHIGNFVLAGLITTAIDSVVSEAQLQCIQTGRLTSDALSNVVVRNRLQMGDVFAGLDRVWGSIERSHKRLSEFCNAPLSGRVECWEQYIGQYGLAYELMPEEDPHLEFLSFPVESELEGTMTKFVYFQTVLRHPSFILRAGTQSYTLYYWCHVLDINQQTALRHQGLGICSEADSCCEKLEKEIDGILGTLGPGVSRWLQLNFLNPDRRLDWVCRSSRHASEEMLESFLHLEKDPSPATMREVREALKLKR